MTLPGLHAKIEIPDLMVPLIPYSDKKCERCRRFSDARIVYFCEFPNFFLKARNAPFAKISQMKINSLKETKTLIWYLIHTWSMGTVVNLTLPSLHGGSLKLRLQSHYSRWGLTHIYYSETLNNEYIERIHQMSYSSLSDNGMLPIFSFLIK